MLALHHLWNEHCDRTATGSRSILGFGNDFLFQGNYKPGFSLNEECIQWDWYIIKGNNFPFCLTHMIQILHNFT